MSNKNKLNKTQLTIIIFVLLFLTPIVLILLGSKPEYKDGITTTPTLPGTAEQTPVNIIPIKMEPDDVNWTVGKTYEVTAEFDETLDITPDYVEVIFIYDPEILSLGNIEPGNLWTDQNVLIKSIDNETGKVKLVYGKAVGSEETQLKKTATLSFKVLDNSVSNTAVVFDPGSNAASSVSEELIKLSSEPLILSIGQ